MAAFGAIWIATSDSAQRSIASIADRFRQLGESVQAGFAGITDAIAAGNLALAGQIAVTSLQLVFETGLSAIRTLWTDWVYDLAGALVVIEIEARNVFSRVQTLVGAALEEIGDATGSAALKAAGTVTAGFGRARIAERESELRGRIGEQDPAGPG